MCDYHLPYAYAKMPLEFTNASNYELSGYAPLKKQRAFLEGSLKKH